VEGVSDAYKVGAKLSVVVPSEPPALAVVIDNDGDAWQNRPGVERAEPWVSTAGETLSWVDLVATRGPLKLVHLG
jgi:hypothetical protein